MTVEARLERIDEKLGTLERHLMGNGQPGACERHSCRIGRLEAWRSYMAGAIATLGVILLGCLIPLAAAALKGK